MARNESDREDLMSEAVSLIRRIEYLTPVLNGPIVAGFNSFGWLFIYVGNDVMYRFDEQGLLRRAFVDGMLYRTEGSALAMLERRRTLESNEVGAIPKTTLIRRNLSSEELDDFRQRMDRELTVVNEAIQNLTATRQYPSDAIGIADEVRQAIQRIGESPKFLAPAIVRR